VKKLVQGLLMISVLALCGLCVAQWWREARYRQAVESLHGQLDDEHRLRVEAEKKITALEQENARIIQLRADTEAKLLELSETFRLTQEDQLQRGTSIILLTNEMLLAKEKALALDLALKNARAALAAQSNAVGGSNEIISAANERLKKLTAQRDAAIREANERTKAYNELAAKYNKLVR